MRAQFQMNNDTGILHCMIMYLTKQNQNAEEEHKKIQSMSQQAEEPPLAVIT